MDMILVGSKGDLEADRKVTKESGEKLALKYGVSFIETSAKVDSNIAEVFEKLSRTILSNWNHPGKQQQPKAAAQLVEKSNKKLKKEDCC